jgi:hypothetical protein
MGHDMRLQDHSQSKQSAEFFSFLIREQEWNALGRSPVVVSTKRLVTPMMKRKS